MARLEYRLWDQSGEESILYYYSYMKYTEIAARMACDYFVKEGRVYEKDSTFWENGLYIIYVHPEVDEQNQYGEPVYSTKREVVLEIREFKECTNQYPLIQVYPLNNMDEMAAFLQGDRYYVGGIQWEKTSAETDEDRGAFVLYGIRAKGE
ncbi:MAG TPA: hypothetical protein DDY49_03330 [Paenibacillaceae bacterium]|nr:hypothetical protein [Paenibacillaceae bacterium]